MLDRSIEQLPLMRGDGTVVSRSLRDGRASLVSISAGDLVRPACSAPCRPNTRRGATTRVPGRNARRTDATRRGPCWSGALPARKGYRLGETLEIDQASRNSSRTAELLVADGRAFSSRSANVDLDALDLELPRRRTPGPRFAARLGAHQPDRGNTAGRAPTRRAPRNA